jgi:hypothetical protein
MNDKKNTARKISVSKQQSQTRIEANNSARRNGLLTASDFSKIQQTASAIHPQSVEQQ